MSTFITHGDDTITPTLVLGYSSEREGQNQVHRILGSPNADITLRPATLRRGTIELLFADVGSETDSKVAEDVHSTGGIFTLLSSDRGTVEMIYVVAGRVRRDLDPATRKHWVVAVEYQEVTA